jgi:hypothetical protein
LQKRRYKRYPADPAATATFTPSRRWSCICTNGVHRLAKIGTEGNSSSPDVPVHACVLTAPSGPTTPLTPPLLHLDGREGKEEAIVHLKLK